MSGHIEYDDGLDADGYPIEEPHEVFVDDGFIPPRLGVSLGKLMKRLELAAELSAVTESPIETMMGVALFEGLSGIENCEIIPQMPWRRFRIDWVVRIKGRPDIFVECDGREFHSAPEDVTRDQFRDEQAARDGITVIRFTGSEIYQNPELCALKVRVRAMG